MNDHKLFVQLHLQAVKEAQDVERMEQLLRERAAEIAKKYPVVLGSLRRS